MPKYNIDYQRSKIYKLCCRDVNITDCYVGSTSNMIRRKSQHKNTCNNEKSKAYNFNVYQFIRNTGGWCNWDMVLVESFPCDSKHELHTRERYWMETLHATLNRSVPTRSKKEYREDNADKVKEYTRELYKKNSEKIKESCRKYRENNVEEGREKAKKYYEMNSEKIKERHREFYKTNIEQIKEKKKEKISCLHCDEIIGRASMTRHIKTKHQ